MKNIIPNMKIGTKIYAGFTMILLLMAVIVVVGQFGLATIRDNLDRYNELAEEQELINDLHSNILAIKGDTLMWSTSEDPELLQKVHEREETIREEIKQLKASFNSQDVLDQIDALDATFAVMNTGVDEVEASGEKIANLIEIQMANRGSRLRQLTEEIVQEAYDDNAYQEAAYVGLALQELVMARMKASSYLLTKEPEDRQEFDEYWKSYGSMVAKMDQMVFDTGRRNALNEIKASRDEYETAVRQAFDSVKVKADVIEEKIFAQTVILNEEIEGLTKAVTERERIVRAELRDTQSNVSVTSISLGLASAILAILVSFVIARQITKPVEAMRNSVQKLADGDVYETIPYTEIGDEIGDMARALADFREEAVQGYRTKSGMERASACIMMADNDLNVVFMNESQEKMLREAESDLKKELPNLDIANMIGANIDVFHSNPQHQRNLLEKMKDSYSTRIEVAGRTFDLHANPAFSKAGQRIGTSIEWVDRTAELKIADEISDIIEGASNGELDKRINLEGKKDFFLEVSQGINNLAEVMENVAGDLAKNLQSLSKGDLTARINSDYNGVFKQLKDDYNATSERLASIVGNIKEISSEVSIRSDEMADSSTGLSDRAEQQASTLEETAASMEELTSTVKANADNAKEANKAANDTRSVAERGSQVANEAGHAMEKINESSKQITEIINVIDEIAFQTNLLALNAAVEAARAGDAGRGFAVVAQEVRTLAQRSAQSSKDIKTLIDDSSKQVGEGVDLVKTAVGSLQEIYDSIEGVASLVGQIASASVEQATSLDELNQAVMEMDSMTQQNAAMAQQSKVTAEGMQRKSLDLEDTVAFFQLDEASEKAREIAIKEQAHKLEAERIKEASNIAQIQPANRNSGKGGGAAKASQNGLDQQAARAIAVGEQSIDNDSDWQEF